MPLDIKPEFSIKVDFIEPGKEFEKPAYAPSNGGHITFEPVRNRKGEILLKWGKVLKVESFDAKMSDVENVRYKVVYSTNKYVNLD